MHALAGGFGDKEGEIKPCEHAGRERFGTCGAIHYDVLAGRVDQVIQVQLDGAGLGVIAGNADVVIGERAGRHQAGAAAGRNGEAMNGIVAADSKEP